jgi:hypothetical protein
MGLLIDTGVLIRVERNVRAKLDLYPWEHYGDAAISVIERAVSANERQWTQIPACGAGGQVRTEADAASPGWCSSGS